MKRLIMTLLLMSSLIPLASSARTKLVTLPGRELVLLNVEHADRNLVMEERTITLEKGVTTIAFSWQGVSIDPASIQLQPLDNPGTVQLISVSYPPNENALEWAVASPAAGPERVRIYYTLWGIERQMEYRLDVAADEKSAVLKANYRLGNLSGEDFDDTVIYTGIGQGVEKSIDAGARLQMLAARFDGIPVTKVYKFKPHERAEAVGWYFEIINSADRGLGQFRLPAGKARVYQASSAGDGVFLGEDYLDALAVQEKDYLYLGDARDVTAKRKIMDTRRENERRAGSNRQMVMWDEVTHIQYEMQNFKDEPVTVVIEEITNDTWEVEELSGPQAKSERKNIGLLEVTVTLPAKSEKIMTDLVIRRPNQTETRF